MKVFPAFVAILAAILTFQIPAAGQVPDRCDFAHQNLWPGFGAGSRLQGDDLYAKRYRTAEITGLAVAGAGALGIAATAYTRDILLAVNGRTTTADYYICGAMIAAGIGTFTVSRIVAYSRAKKVEASLAPVPVAGGGGVAVKLSF